MERKIFKSFLIFDIMVTELVLTNSKYYEGNTCHR